MTKYALFAALLSACLISPASAEVESPSKENRLTPIEDIDLSISAVPMPDRNPNHQHRHHDPEPYSSKGPVFELSDKEVGEISFEALGPTPYGSTPRQHTVLKRPSKVTCPDGTPAEHVKTVSKNGWTHDRWRCRR